MLSLSVPFEYIQALGESKTGGNAVEVLTFLIARNLL